METKVVRMLGGLANRMFQYVLCEYLKQQGYKACVENYYVPKKWVFEAIDWERIFPNAPLTYPSKFGIWLNGGCYDIISKIRRKFKFTYKYYQAPSAFNIPTKEEIEKNRYFAGVFQNAIPSIALGNDVHKIFEFSPFVDERNIALQKEMQECESVAIHVRKGKDYLSRDAYIGTCQPSYYNEAVAYIRKNYPNARFYLFTDNIEWVKENLPNVVDVSTLVDWNPAAGWGNHFDMQLMSCAKHNIIANSTYSWWGAFLNRNPNKIVIGPKLWFSPNCNSSKYNNTTIPSGWVTM